MLHLAKLLAAKPKEHVTAKFHELHTPWGEALDVAHVLEEHPTPQFARADHISLNGVWRCAFAASGHDAAADPMPAVEGASCPEDAAFGQEIIVPFSPEAPLSGVGRALQPDELMWYRRAFQPPALVGGKRLILHFQAVDYACAVYVNGVLATTHVGGYLPFCCDITDLLQDGDNELSVCVADPSEYGGQLRGKQRFDRGDIWYTAQSGIWQSVWMEAVPPSYLVSATIEPDAETGVLAVGLRAHMAGGAPQAVSLDVLDGGCVVAHAACEADETCAVAVHVENPVLWSPENPHLYRLRLTFGDDEVESYCAFRSVQVRNDAAGNARLCLNGKPYFLKGVLDQGYWPDGLMTAPADDALVFDIETMKAAGFNLLRKHIKVESARWYYHCDRLGMLVWQDMVSGGDRELNDWQFSYKPSLFKASWNRFSDRRPKHWELLGAGEERYRDEWLRGCCDTVALLASHPSIVAWTLFNEAWGQFDSARAYEVARAADPTRPICATSGWYDQGAGEIRGVHNYFRDFAVWKRGLRGRAFVITEFGGYAHHVDGHSALDEVYGYEVYDTIDQWREHTRSLLDEVCALQDRGLAGFVLTQLSDIEEETNGILTYDRRVNKLA